MAEGRMNLAALQQRDPYITDIVDTASQVALYSFNSKANEWEKTSIEGALFVYKRSASPNNGFMILNRLGLNNLIEPITKDLEFQLQDPFLLYRNAKAIYGIWFYDKDECGRVGQLMNGLLQLALDNHRSKSSALRGRRASESSMQDMVSELNPGAKNVDILQMLSKAQHEYDQAKSTVPKKVGPKPFIDNPNASAMKSTDLIRPTPLKIGNGAEDEGAVKMDPKVPQTAPASNTISLESLFRNASIQQQQQQQRPPAGTKDVKMPSAPAFHRSVSISEGEYSTMGGTEGEKDDLPPLLKHIMSSGSMVEDIERQQRGEPPRGTQTASPVQDKPKAMPTFHLASSDISTGQLASRGQSVKQTSPREHSLKQSSPKEVLLHQTANVDLGDKLAKRSSNESLPGDTGYSNMGIKDKDAPYHVAKIGNVQSDSENVLDLLGTRKSPSVFPSVTGSMQSGTVGGSNLLTPAELEQSFSSQNSSGSKVPEMKSSGTDISMQAAAASISTDVLLTPMAFVQGVQSTSPPSAPVVDMKKSLEEVTVAALTKEQLQRAMLYLIKNDPSFINTLHEAYLKSLKDLAYPKT